MRDLNYRISLNLASQDAPHYGERVDAPLVIEAPSEITRQGAHYDVHPDAVAGYEQAVPLLHSTIEEVEVGRDQSPPHQVQRRSNSAPSTALRPSGDGPDLRAVGGVRRRSLRHLPECPGLGCGNRRCHVKYLRLWAVNIRNIESAYREGHHDRPEHPLRTSTGRAGSIPPELPDVTTSRHGTRPEPADLGTPDQGDRGCAVRCHRRDGLRVRAPRAEEAGPKYMERNVCSYLDPQRRSAPRVGHHSIHPWRHRKPSTACSRSALTSALATWPC